MILEAIKEYLHKQGLDFDKKNGEQIRRVIEDSKRIRTDIRTSDNNFPQVKHFWVETLKKYVYTADQDLKKQLQSEIEAWQHKDLKKQLQSVIGAIPPVPIKKEKNAIEKAIKDKEA